VALQRLKPLAEVESNMAGLKPCPPENAFGLPNQAITIQSITNFLNTPHPVSSLRHSPPGEGRKSLLGRR